jgi:MFS superfamily sulfate permease-like transporter
MFGQKHGYRVDTNQEFLALAGANLAAGLGHGFPVSGGMSQSLVNESGGARTPLSGLVSALLILLVACFLSGLLRDLPQPVLAAIVLVAVGGLFKVEALARLWRFSRHRVRRRDGRAARRARLGPPRGVLIGAVLSILILLRRASRPAHDRAGPRVRREVFRRPIRNPENQREPGVFVLPQLGRAASTSTSSTCAIGSSSSWASSEQRAVPCTSWAPCRSSIWPGRSSWPSCTGRSPRGASSSAWPARRAACARRW